MEPAAFTVLVADARPLWVEVVTHTLVRAGIRVVAEVSTAAALGERADELLPDVVVSDTRLADGSALPTLAWLVAQQEQLRVLVLSDATERADVTGAVRAGVTSYLPSTVDATTLVDAVQRTAAGESVVPAELAGAVLAEYRSIARTPRLLRGRELTAREKEVLSLLGRGMSYADIADELYLSGRTVGNHAQHIMRKLSLHSRVELALYAIEHGYTRPEDPR